MIKKIKIKHVLIACALIASTQTSAQKNYFIRPVAGYGITNLYNAEDTKQAPNVKLGTTPMPTKTTFSPNIGMQFGLHLSNKKFGLQAISTGLVYTPIVQKYSGYLPYDTANINNRFDNANATIRLHYISIPLLAEFNLSKPHKITPIAAVGVNINVLPSYNIDFESPYINSSTYNIAVKNSSFSNTVSTDPINSYTASLDKWYYKKLVIASNIGIGAKMAVNSKLDCQVMLNNSISFGDVENKTNIQYAYTDAAHAGASISRNPYEYYYAISKNRSRWANSTTRKATYAIQTGLAIGFTYKLNNNN